MNDKYTGFASKELSTVLLNYFDYDGKYFWRGKKLLHRGKQEGDTTAIPSWKLLEELLKLFDTLEDYKLAFAKTKELFFDKIIYKGVLLYVNKELKVQEDTFEDFLGTIYIKLASEK